MWQIPFYMWRPLLFCAPAWCFKQIQWFGIVLVALFDAPAWCFGGFAGSNLRFHCTGVVFQQFFNVFVDSNVDFLCTGTGNQPPTFCLIHWRGVLSTFILVVQQCFGCSICCTGVVFWDICWFKSIVVTSQLLLGQPNHHCVYQPSGDNSTIIG